MAGLTSTGMEIKTTSDVLDELERDQRAAISPSVNTSSAGVLGQINGVFADKVAELWEALLAVWSGGRPDAATGASLTSLALLTGTQRLSATNTLVQAVEVNLNAGVTLPAGSRAHVDGDPDAIFESVDDVTNSGGVPATVTVDFQAVETGAVQCVAGTLTEIITNVTGWNSVNNPDDGIVGQEDEGDSTLRTRREDELEASGNGSADAIRADILRNLVDNVTHCKVLANDTDEVDANGLPPHSFEVIARGLVTNVTQSAALARQILASKTDGDQAYGTGSAIVEDSQGNEFNIGFTWVTEQDTWVEVDLDVTNDFPADGDDQVKAAIAAIEDTYEPGDDVIAERLKAACFTVTGVRDVTALRLGFTASPVGTTNLTIGVREIAELSTARVLVNF